MRIIGKGAEAVLYLTDNKLVKERIKKGYRIEALDIKIRKSCTRKEYKLLVKASALINVPRVLEFCDKEMKITMEFIDGQLFRDILDEIHNKKRIELCGRLGQDIALLHDNNIIHGDLTTSNFILKDDKIYFIDFGLGFVSHKVEDKAVDLHLLRQALESKHYKHFEESFRAVLEGYKKSRNYKDVIERLEKVEKRGRYKKK